MRNPVIVLAATATAAVIVILAFTFSDRSAGAAPPPGAISPVTVGSFSIRSHSFLDERMPWAGRAEAVEAALRKYEPDIFALQDVFTRAASLTDSENLQLLRLIESFPAYRFAAFGDPAEFPSSQPIMVRSSRFDVLEQGFFSFSAEPESAYGAPWDGRALSFCSWVRLQDTATNARLRIFNVKLDRENAGNRRRSAELLVERLQDHARTGDRVIVVGDLAAIRASRPVRLLTAAELNAAGPRGSTYHFGRGLNVLPATDHILAGPGFAPWDAWADRGRYLGTWPSDHYPIYATLTYR